MVAFDGVDPDAGAVYRPLPSIVPAELEPDTDQLTASDAANCLVPPSGTFALVGVIVNAGGGGGLELAAWQATMIPIRVSDANTITGTKSRLLFFRVIPKVRVPVIGSTHSQNGNVPCGSLLASSVAARRGPLKSESQEARRVDAPAPVFGPAVVIVKATEVDPAPVAIELGLNTHAAVESGKPVQLNVTLPVKPFSGVMVIVFPEVVCPAATVCEPDPADKEKAGKVASHAVAKLFRLTEPKPVTRLYPVVASFTEAS